MEIQARFTHNRLDYTQDSNPHLVLTLTAPALDWVTQRPKVCITPVIDLSGSMDGGKLEYAKKSMLKLVDQLQPGDFSGLVAFESKAHVLVKPAEVTAAFKTKLRNAIERLSTMGGTNYADGMLRALEVIQKLDLPATYLKRAIMFTDGQPTEGVLDLNAILRLLEQKRSSVTMSAFGYGNIGGGVWGGCDQEFLTRFATTGAGNYAYVKDPDDALAAFGKELGGLLSTYATDLRVEIEPVHGHHITKTVTDIPTTELVGQTEFKVPDILSEESRHFVFETKILKQNKSFPRDATIFKIRLAYDILTEDGKRETRTTETTARLRFVKPEDADKAPDKAVDEIVGLHQVIRTQLDAEEQAKKGEFQTAGDLMEQLQKSLQGRGHAGIAKSAGNVRRRLASHAVYADASSQGYLNSFRAGGTRAYGTSSMDADAQQDLIGSNVVLSNQAMEHMTSNFVDPKGSSGSK